MLVAKRYPQLLLGEFHFPGDKWRKIDYEKSSTEKSNYEPIEFETKTYSGGVKILEEEEKVYSGGFKPIPNDGPTK